MAEYEYHRNDMRQTTHALYIKTRNALGRLDYLCDEEGQPLNFLYGQEPIDDADSQRRGNRIAGTITRARAICEKLEWNP